MHMESIWMFVCWKQVWRYGWRGEGIKKTNGSLQNSQGDVKYSVGNGVAKELTQMTLGLNNGVGIALGSGGVLCEGCKEGNGGTTVISYEYNIIF